MRGYWTAAAITGAVLILTGCEAAEAPAPVEDAPILLKAGQWTMDRTITGYNTPDITAEDYARMVGTKSTAEVCLTVDAKGQPDPNALAGAEGEECTYKEPSIRKGRFIANLTCKAGKGTSELVLEGNYKADSMTLGVSMTKMEGGNAVLRTTHDLTAKRTGECKAR
ncbi:MAG: DUF3617 domain-containing protein [Sphingobium sp.]|uniref:DUF3617 domain-containing protein n=1 Tax=Sphingobium sp. TaxID=1912891 RepID=UPI0029A79167|nr:DUF3617 domain-containing protein [Sphingobium sp.]MDX3910282.1 DUF3617 domain-containing protein [Sphingobium sp.]